MGELCGAPFTSECLFVPSPAPKYCSSIIGQTTILLVMILEDAECLQLRMK